MKTFNKNLRMNNEENQLVVYEEFTDNPLAMEVKYVAFIPTKIQLYEVVMRIKVRMISPASIFLTLPDTLQKLLLPQSILSKIDWFIWVNN